MRGVKYLKGVVLGLSMLAFTSCSTVPKIVDLSPKIVNKRIKGYDKLHVMIVCGDHEKEFVEDTRKAYNEFKKLGCSDEDIYLLAPYRAKGLEGIVDRVANRTTFLDELKNFESRVGPNDVFFFYYTDHGDRIGGKSYIGLPSASGKRGADCISESDLEKGIKDIKAKCSIFFIDSCYSGGFSGLAKDSKIFISLSDKDEKGFKRSKFPHYFFEALNYVRKADKDYNSAVSVEEAFEYALEKDKLSRGKKPFWRVFFPRPELTYDEIDPAKVFLKKQ